MEPTAQAKPIIIAPDIRGLPLNPKKPLIKDGMELLPEVERLDLNQRPMIWCDLPVFAAKHSRTAMDMMYDLGLNTPYLYQRDAQRRSVVPYDLELLMRMYDMDPSSCSWNRPTLREVFDLLYGDVLRGFPEELFAKATLAYGARFARMLGRATTVQYRWLMDDSSSTRRISNIVTKIRAVELAGRSAIQTFESLAIVMWARRGYDVNAGYPAYSPETIVIKNVRQSNVRAKVARRLAVPDPSYKGGAFG
ncbi:hypothetical protein KBW71_00145 [Hydrogenophaga aromaticivorans]|uniref:hypothetical protein n=1 Tax=Hydrogenophaga aromaticivorans TaxID=2610898 RepID=UPI001B35F0C0|nr:hypothetical protein [Hydrogenophaga aromaticivorans]MBQ0916859.1 hypothetical protein [Hydrogenophaga aromaticivorans]